MSSARTGAPEELAGHQTRRAGPRPIFPNGPGYPRIIQAWLWLKKPTWFLDHCSRVYGDVFTMRLPLGTDIVHIARPELVKAIFGGDNDVFRAGEANATIIEPLVGPHSVLVLDGPEHLRQRKLILPAFHGDRMRVWEATIRDLAGLGSRPAAAPSSGAEPPGRGAGPRRVGLPGRHDHGDVASPAGGRARGSACAPGRQHWRAHDSRRSDRVPQHLPCPT